MLKNLLHMGISTFARLLSGAVLFVAMAKFLGPVEYGILVYNFSIAMMLTLVIEFGHSTFLVKAISENNADSIGIMENAFSAKIYLTGIYIISCFSVLAAGVVKWDSAGLFACLAVAAILLSFADFFNIAFRGMQLFHKESRNVVAASLIHFAFVFPSVFYFKSASSVAISFIISRIVYLIISILSYKYWFGVFCSPSRESMRFSAFLRNGAASFAFAADNTLVSIRSYVDILCINWMLGPAQLGIYQVGMNIVKAVENLAPVVANVYLPRLVAIKNDAPQIRRQYRDLFTLMLSAGLVLVIMSFCVTEFMVGATVGKAYMAMYPLIPLFGIFIFSRFITISQGVLATVFNLQKYRTYAGAATLLVLSLSSITFIHYFGLMGALIANIISTLFLLLFFSILLNIKKVKLIGGIFSMCLFSAAIAVIVVIYVGMRG